MVRNLLGFLLLVALGTAQAEFPAVTVPVGARAGEVLLESCTLGEGDSAVAAECGTLVVAENRRASNSRLIALPVVRVRARGATAGVPVFNLNGGPGSSNLVGAPPSWLSQTRDVVAVGYRGADGSVILNMPTVQRSLRHTGGDLLAEASISAMARAIEADFSTLQANGVDVAAYGIADVVSDMDEARIALGYERVDLISASYGTRVAQRWAELEPNAIHRSLMIAVNPPGRMVWEPDVLDEQIMQISALCATDAACGRRTGDLAETMRSVVRDMPNRWLFLPIDAGKVRLAAFVMMSVTPPEFSASVLNAFMAAGRGDASGLAAISLMFSLPPFDLTRASIWGDLLAKGMSDFDPQRDYLRDMDPADSILGSPHSLLFFGAAQLERPEVGRDPQRPTGPLGSDVETLLVSGSLDLSTPARYATEELLPALRRGRQVILDGYGHLDYYTPPDAFERMVLGFLDRGEVDVSLYPEKGFDFAPAIDFPLIGKAIVAIGAALLVLLVLIGRWVVGIARRRSSRGAV